jgi:integrase
MEGVMPRKVKDRNLDSREARLKLKVRGMPYYRSLDKKLHVGYRRLKGKAGTWWARHYEGDREYIVEPIGIADDLSDADGIEIFDYWQAKDRARERRATRVQAAAGPDGQTITVSLALDRYEANLKARGADAGNVARVRAHITESLAGRPLPLLTGHSLELWRNSLLTQMAAASVNRVCNAFRAALNLVADSVEGIQNRAAWDIGLKAIPDATEGRNVVILDSEVRRLVEEAPRESVEFALFVEVLAVTGARPSQVGRILVRDAKGDHVEMPSSRKGRGQKKITRRVVPIPPTLGARLREAAAGKSLDAPLLTKPNGTPWKKSDHSRLFRRTAKRARLDAKVVTIYALRHSSITRQLKAGIPIRVVAVLHDTSVAMIEKSYSVDIDKHVGQIVRPALLDMGPSNNPDPKIATLSARR